MVLKEINSIRDGKTGPSTFSAIDQYQRIVSYCFQNYKDIINDWNRVIIFNKTAKLPSDYFTTL